ncbi:MAG: Na+/H+ antiporter NhaC family protein [Alistipes sp.]|nr:Na+/H+ antiporter NhaC family protein [Alistipes sp.]
MKRVFEKSPSAMVSLIPLVVLAALLFLVITAFGSDSINGGSQIALLSASSVCVMLATTLYNCSWRRLEDEIIENIRSSASAIIILLLIGSIAGTWMVSGVVPTLICYGLKVIHPSWFLAATCIICAVVSLMTGSSWTTIATIGVALMGIGRAMGFSEGWIAGAIISGAYFGDKISLLSDTTVLASSTAGVPLFTHVRYMLITTIPSFVIALLVFLIKSLSFAPTLDGESIIFSETLHESFNITPWLLLVPIITALLIARKLPAIVTLFVATLLAALSIAIFQPHLLSELAGGATSNGFITGFKGVLTACFGSTSLDTGVGEVNDLVSTRGMAGMMNTVWLILCAMCFGGVMTGSGMLGALTKLFLKFVRRTTTTVAATVGAGIFFNLATADQYISIILTGRLFRDMYNKAGLEPRLLSRSVEDSATVTSVLVPWNSCGMTQATVLGISTFAYLPYCIFNYLSPLMSILVAALGYKIFRK